MINNERVSSDGGITWDTLRTNWQGQIDKELRLELTKYFSINCFGTIVQGTANYTSIIIRETNKYKFELAGEEVWCPSEGCIFNRRYIMTKMIIN